MQTPGPSEVTIPSRFVGPPGAAHGGYLGGRMAGLMPDHPSVQIRLRAPTPVETPLTVDRDESPSVRLVADGDVCAEARPSEFEAEIPTLVSFDDAEQAGADAWQAVWGLLPAEMRRDFEASDERDRCFGCAPRSDGLNLLPGKVTNDVTAAAVRIPSDLTGQGRVPREIVWAAVDCPSMWACKLLADADEQADLFARVVVTGTLAVRVHGLPQADERLFVQAWRIGRDGRKLFGGAVLVGEDDEIIAEALQTAVVL